MGTALALQLVLTKVMARVMGMFLAWAVVKARKISRTMKQFLTILTTNTVYDITLLMTSL